MEFVAPMPALFFIWPCRTHMTSYQFLYSYIYLSFIILLIYSYVRHGPTVSCRLLRQTENRCSSLFVEIYSLFLSRMVGVNQWDRGDPPALLPKPAVSSQSTFPKWKASPPQSQSSITLLPPSDCCLSSFIRLLMVYKLRVMIPPLPSVLGDFYGLSGFVRQVFVNGQQYQGASRAVCREAGG